MTLEQFCCGKKKSIKFKFTWPFNKCRLTAALSNTSVHQQTTESESEEHMD